MKIGVGLSIPELSTRGGKFSPASLFTGGAKGVWYSPDDYSTLFQDSAGTTPVTAVEQPVGLMLDKSQGLVLGSQLVTNGDNESAVFSFGSLVNADTLARATAPGGGFAASFTSNTSSSTAHRSYDSVSTLQAGRNYIFSGRFYVPTGGISTFKLFDNGDGSWFGVSSTVKDQWVSFSVIRTAKSLNWSLGIGDNVASVVTSGQVAFWLDDLSIRELPGNHASQSTAASRPVLRARYNLLTYSEQFDNAAWTKSQTTLSTNTTTAPDGTTTADSLIEDNTLNSHRIQQAATTTSGAVHTLSTYIKKNTRSWVALYASGANVGRFFNVDTGTTGGTLVGAPTTSTITAVGNGWYRCEITFTATASTTYQIYLATGDGVNTYTGDGTSGLYVWGADLRTGSSAGTYQRIAAATDYATAGFLPYLATDGTDDTLSSGNIDLTGTSKLSAVVGATKNNDGNVYAIVDFGATGGSTAGGFSMWAGSPTAGGAAAWASSFQSSAGGTINIISPTNFPAPATAVVTGILDTVAAGSYLRVNGALQTTSAIDPTDGTFGNLPLRLSRTGGNGLPGRIYQLVVVGKTLSASELASTEAFVATKTGVAI